MADTTVTTKIRFVTEGGDSAVQDMAKLASEAQQTADALEAADAAATGLGQAVSNIPDIPDATLSSASNQVKSAAKEAGDALEKTAAKTLDAGKASEMLYSALDSVIPGLGGVTESLFSMNPVAIAGTAVIAGLTLAFAENQRQAEETRKAVEAQVNAEAQRAYDQMDVNQRLNLALSGDKTARENLIKDLAAANAEAARLNAQGADLIKQRNEAQAEADKQLAIVHDDAASIADSIAANDAWNEALLKVNAANDAIEELTPTIEAANTNFELTQAAVDKLNLSEAELNALRLSETQGVDGTVAALEKLNEQQEKTKNFFTDLAGNVQKGLSDLKDKALKGLTDTAAKVAEEQAKKRADAEKSLIETNAKLAEVETERGKVLADRITEEQRANEIGKLESRLKLAQEYDAAVERNKKIKDIQDQGNAAEVAAQQKFMEGQQKLLANYLKAEQNATEDYSRERVRKLEDLYNTLNDLASKRDVARFVNARRSGMTDIGRSDADAGIAAQRRRADYEAQAKDQQVAFDKERTQRQQQLQQRIQQEQQAGQQQIKQADIVQKQIAALREQYAQADLRARRAQEDATYRQTISILEKKRADELKITAGAAAGVLNFIGQIGQAANRLGGLLGGLSSRSIPKFDVGTDYVQRTGLAIVHEGEKIIPASQNTPYARNYGRGMGNVIINMSVGEIATPSQIDAVEARIVGALVSFGANSNI